MSHRTLSDTMKILDIIVNVVGSHWKVINQEILCFDACFHKDQLGDYRRKRVGGV